MSASHPKSEESIEHKALKGGKALLARHGVAFIFNFGGGVLLARKLGPELMGVYFAVFAWFMIGRSIIEFGTTARLIQRSEEPDRDWLSSVFGLQVGLVGILWVIAAVLLLSPFAHWYMGDKSEAFGWILGAAALGLSVYGFQCVSTAMMERRLSYLRVGIVEMSEPLVFNLLAVALVFWRPTAPSLALALLLRGWVPAFLALALSGVRPSWRFEVSGMKKLLRELWPLVSGNAVVWGLGLAPSMILVPLAGPGPFALANMTYSLLGSFGFLVGVFQRVSFASFSRIKSEPERLNRIAGKLLNFLEFFYVPLYFGLSAFASLWVPLVYGEKWSGMAELFMWWAVPMTLVALSTVFYASTLAGSRNRLVLYQNLLHASIFVGVLALVAPSLKALAWPIAHMAAVPAALLYVLSHRRHYGPLHLGRVFAGLVAGVVWMTSSHWLILNDHPYGALALASAFLGVWYLWMGKDLPIRRWAMGGGGGGWDDLSDLSQKG